MDRITIQLDSAQLRALTEEEMAEMLRKDQEQIIEVFAEAEEVCELFQIVQELVGEQGERLDLVEKQIQAAEINVEQAVEHLEAASDEVRKGVLVKVFAVAGGVFGGGLGLVGLVGGPAVAAVTVPAGAALVATLGGSLGKLAERKLSRPKVDKAAPESKGVEKLRTVVFRILPFSKAKTK